MDNFEQLSEISAGNTVLKVSKMEVSSGNVMHEKEEINKFFSYIINKLDIYDDFYQILRNQYMISKSSFKSEEMRDKEKFFLTVIDNLNDFQQAVISAASTYNVEDIIPIITCVCNCKKAEKLHKFDNELIQAYTYSLFCADNQMVFSSLSEQACKMYRDANIKDILERMNSGLYYSLLTDVGVDALVGGNFRRIFENFVNKKTSESILFEENQYFELAIKVDKNDESAIYKYECINMELGKEIKTSFDGVKLDNDEIIKLLYCQTLKNKFFKVGEFLKIVELSGFRIVGESGVSLMQVADLKAQWDAFMVDTDNSIAVKVNDIYGNLCKIEIPLQLQKAFADFETEENGILKCLNAKIQECILDEECCCTEIRQYVPIDKGVKQMSSYLVNFTSVVREDDMHTILNEIISDEMNGAVYINPVKSDIDTSLNELKVNNMCITNTADIFDPVICTDDTYAYEESVEPLSSLLRGTWSVPELPLEELNNITQVLEDNSYNQGNRNI